ncbi:exo-beta-N-acetylmuramidase NamZ domain-containing protein [Flavobacterium beibuense]|uniref:exo-beta-N-acetylmuramidase NamZ family protein n=1 Tax=Flavobacterium beibuense TaxID=657326 RepID=UPI003A8F4666
MVSFSLLKNTFLFSFILIGSCGNSVSVQKAKPEAQKKQTETYYKENQLLTEIKTGAENYKAYLPLLEGKNIGIVTNQTGTIINNGNTGHVVDFLFEKKVALKKIYAPEHGFRGTADAGEHIKDGKDTKTGLPIISLYGNNKKPKAEQLAGIDVMLFDLQDVGARFYTYISTLHYVMEACAENNIQLIVLDRPNPNGSIVDGPVLEKEYTSFVGMHAIPVLHGMTIGEYGQMINGEKWLNNGIKCNLTVIPCLNYNRDLEYHLPVKPSPNLPNDQSISLYPSLCFFEGTNVSVGRGTNKQFQVYGSPFLPKTGFSFTPAPNEGAKDPMYNGKVCFGEDLTKVQKPKQLELKWLIEAYSKTEDKSKFFIPFFTKLAGTKKLQEQIENETSESDIRKSWEQGLNKFKLIRKKYLIYK